MCIQIENCSLAGFDKERVVANACDGRIKQVALVQPGIFTYENSTLDSQLSHLPPTIITHSKLHSYIETPPGPDPNIAKPPRTKDKMAGFRY